MSAREGEPHFVDFGPRVILVRGGPPAHLLEPGGERAHPLRSVTVSWFDTSDPANARFWVHPSELDPADPDELGEYVDLVAILEGHPEDRLTLTAGDAKPWPDGKGGWLGRYVLQRPSQRRIWAEPGLPWWYIEVPPEDAEEDTKVEVRVCVAAECCDESTEATP